MSSIDHNDLPTPRPLARREWLGSTSMALAGLYARPGVHIGQQRHETPAREIERWMRLASVPGMAYARVAGERITTRGFGARRTGAAADVSGETIFAAASLSKPVFAYVVLTLASDGVLSLDRPLHEYLPLPNPDDERARRITVRHVLSHSTGWRNWRNQLTQPLTSDFEPGSRFSYSGEGYFHLQRAVERLTNRAFPAVARERVFGPLGMESSSFAWLPDLEGRRASGHTNRGDPSREFGVPLRNALARMAQDRKVTVEELTTEDTERAMREAEPNLPVLGNFMAPNAAASLTTTAGDYARFLRHLVRARSAGGAAARLVETITTPTTPINEELRWGVGTGLQVQGDRTTMWHWGDNPGFKNFFLADPAAGTAVVVFNAGDAGKSVYERLLRSELGEDQPAFLFI
ncbi:MAG: serine hydrolase domain-containing protein [Gemmatimonadaceae bacterium]